MSACWCIKCAAMVGGYEKYCANCTYTYGVKNDFYFWKNQADVTVAWNNREEIFKRDLAAVPVMHVSKDIQPETMAALHEMASVAMENLPTKKKRKRSHGTKNVRT